MLVSFLALWGYFVTVVGGGENLKKSSLVLSDCGVVFDEIIILIAVS